MVKSFHPLVDKPLSWLRANSIDINYHVGEGDIAYRHQSFSQMAFEYASDSDIMSANECLAASLILVCNAAVVAVFLRVLGLMRAASKVILNMALANFVVALDLFIHSSAVRNRSLGGSRESCRLTYLFHVSCWVLERGCMSTALMERLLALNMPLYHTNTLPYVLSALILAPWIYWLVIIVMSFEGFFKFDMGFTCQHHLTQEPMDITVELVQIFASGLAAVLFVCLVMSRLMHSPHADDAWEVNRQKMEMKTAFIIGQVFALDALMQAPYTVISAIAHYSRENIYFMRTIAHICKQFSIYSSCLLLFVLLQRRDLRKAFVLLVASKDTIRRSHQPNFLVAASKLKKKPVALLEEQGLRAVPEPAAREDTRSVLDKAGAIEWSETETRKRSAKRKLWMTNEESAEGKGAAKPTVSSLKN